MSEQTSCPWNDCQTPVHLIPMSEAPPCHARQNQWTRCAFPSPLLGLLPRLSVHKEAADCDATPRNRERNRMTTERDHGWVAAGAHEATNSASEQHNSPHHCRQPQSTLRCEQIFSSPAVAARLPPPPLLVSNHVRAAKVSIGNILYFLSNLDVRTKVCAKQAQITNSCRSVVQPGDDDRHSRMTTPRKRTALVSGREMGLSRTSGWTWVAGCG